MRFLPQIIFYVVCSGIAVAAAPVISTLTVSPKPATTGQQVTLTWDVTGADTLSLNGSDVTGQVSKVITAPALPSDYILIASNADGTATRSVLVDVLPAALPVVGVRLNEVVTSNVSGLQDEDGTRQDWIELYNTSGSPVDLSGWHLTDDRQLTDKWTFPSISIPAQDYLVIFASGKNRAVAGRQLHTNFKLDEDGEFLSLTDAAGLGRSSFPGIPPLQADQSYGYGPGNTRTLVQVSPGTAALKWHVPASPVEAAWRGRAAFDDSSWSNGRWSLGYGSTQTTAYGIPGGTVGTQSYAGSLGMDFEVLRPIEVTDLACFDSGSNGLSRTITVVLWSRNQNGTPEDTANDVQGTVRASQTFTAASPGTLSGGQRFKPLAAPVTLAPGSYTIVAYNYGATELNGNSAEFNNNTNSGNGALRFTGSSRYGVTTPPASVTASWPGTPDGGPAARYGAGSFRFQEAASVGSAIGTAMQNINATLLTRTAFEVSFHPQHPVLNISYDDGFVAWINGVEVARKNAPELPSWDSLASITQSAEVNIPLESFTDLFRSENILAIQGLNKTADDSDFRLSATITGEAGGIIAGFMPAPSPGAANTNALLASGLIINEIHSDPTDSKIRFTEFVEIYNPLSKVVDVGQWSLTGGVAYTIPTGTLIQPGGYLVIGENPAHLLTFYFFRGALGPWTGSVGNEKDGIVLRDRSLTVVDRVNYEQGFPWPTVGNDPGASLQRIHEGLEGDLGGSWRSAVPTPGARNTPTTGLVPPAIRQVEHTPSAPLSGQAVTVTAKITDPDRVAAAWLEYQIVEPGTYIRVTDAAWNTKWITLALHDDGVAGDAKAGDDVYSVNIPSDVQRHRRLIRYRIRAWDGALTAIRVPYGDDDTRNFAYFCYDGVPAWTAAVRPGVTPRETIPAATMNKVRPWHLLSNATDVQNCQYNSSFNDGSYRFEGTLVLNGTVYDHIHYRVKGQNSTFNTGKNKWKLQFNRGRFFEMPDDYGRSTTTVKTLNISSVPAPWAPWNRGLHGLDEAMAFRLNTLAGVPAPRTSYLQLRVIDNAVEQHATNQFDGDFWGLYLAFENTDNRFKEAHGLPDGNIFRLIGNEGGNRVIGQGRGQPTNLSDLNAFTSTSSGYRKGGGSALTAPTVAAIQNEAWFRANVNLPEYFSWRSVTEAINASDRREQENVVYFRDPADGRWQILPWDCDLLYENFDRWGPKSVQTSVDLQQYEQIARGLLHPAILTEFQNRARELQDLLLNHDQAGQLVDEFLSIITDESPRIIPPGAAINDGFVEAERRRWDYNPTNPTTPRGAGPTGNYYKNPYPIGNMSNGPLPQPYTRVLPSGDFEGMVKWVKDFIATGQNGGARLTKMTKGEVLPYTLASAVGIQIPVTPVISYSGPEGYPLNQLQFSSSAFTSPNGQTFSAQEWRIGGIYDPSVPGFTAGEPWRYEIQGIWTPMEQTNFSAAVSVPATGLVSGRTYRARVRHKDSLNRWSHWSAPWEFRAGTAVPGDLATNLVISEIMYNPIAPEGSDAEYLELLNIHPVLPLDLSGVQFVGGIDFSFAPGTNLASGGRLLVVRNKAVFIAKYGAALPIAGEYQFNQQNSLANGGERLVLSLGGASILRDFIYNNVTPWPETPDNGGNSLVLVSPGTNPDHALPSSWKAGLPTPGAAGGAGYDAWKATHLLVSDEADPDGDGLNSLLEYGTGSLPGVPSPDAGISVSKGTDGLLLLSVRRNTQTDDVRMVLEKSTDLVSWAPVTGTLVSRTEGVGNERLVFQLPPEAAGLRYFYHARYTLVP